MEQTTEKWKPLPQEIENKVDGLEEGKRKNNISVFGFAEGDNEGN
jgi:hypothetical protein